VTVDGLYAGTGTRSAGPRWNCSLPAAVESLLTLLRSH
jgi:hypothetical protein